MAKKGGSRHLKRYAAPRVFQIPVKEHKWAVKPEPGPHPQDFCIPLGIVIRDLLGYAKTLREAKKILANREVLVDGRPRTSHKYPVGLMDVVEIPKAGERFRVVPHPVKQLTLHPISEEEAKFKLCMVKNKTTVNGGHIQLNLHDGSNILVRVSDPRNPVEDVYKTKDVLKVSLPEREILDKLEFKEGALAVIIGGKNVGKVGRIEKIQVSEFYPKRKLVLLKSMSGEEICTTPDKVFVIGVEEPVISMPEECFKP